MSLKSSLLAIIAASLLYVCSAEFADEIQVYEQACLGDNVYHCQDGGCITQEQYCDGRPDCNDDSDESFCSGNHFHTQDNACNTAHEFTCTDHSRCVPFTWLCNGVDDCDDASDEANCTGRRELSKDCKGHQCHNGACISWLWVCDGTVDCEDKSDEYNVTLCREKVYSGEGKRPTQDPRKFDVLNCEDLINPQSHVVTHQYTCEDHSFCLDEEQMCDGMNDCRDGSDEGAFCAKWPSMCDKYNCTSPAKCKRSPSGPSCECGSLSIYDNATRTCVDRDECLEALPRCSHTCVNTVQPFTCQCEDGYKDDRFQYLCFAPDPEPLLFFSTRNEIRYMKMKSRQQITVVTGLKQAHGVTYDGTFLYWVETAQGHQSIVRAKLDNVAGTKETLVALGLEDPGDISIDWLNNMIYFTDAELGHIAACFSDGSLCTVLNTTAKHPRFVTLYPQKGQMFWADYHNRSVIMRSFMDGSSAKVFVDNLRQFPSGLTLDAPSERLFFVDQSVIIGVRLDGKGQFILVESAFHHPYALSVFENTVYWSDWTSNSLQAWDKVNPIAEWKKKLIAVDAPVFGLHMYHPLLMKQQSHGCSSKNCSDICLLRGQAGACACGQGRKLVDDKLCSPSSFHELPQFLIVGAGNSFTRIRYHSLGNPEARAVDFDIGRVQAMAYNNFLRILYIYDGQRHTINLIHMNDFSKGTTKILLYENLENVVDMDYDYVSNTLYFADAARQVIEVFSITTNNRAVVHHFRDEAPISICVVSDYGLLMVAVVSLEDRRDIRIDSMGLDGKGRKHVLEAGLKGPHIRLRYHQGLDKVFISDEGNGVIDYIHPTGTGKENYRELSTTVASLAASDTTIFWADRRTPRLFWSGAHETAQTVRRIDMGIFPNHTQLLLQSTSPFPAPAPHSPLLQHACYKQSPCSHVCVQVLHPTPMQVQMEFNLGYACLCPSGLMLVGDTCESLKDCQKDQVHCREDNTCVEGKRCDGVVSCKGGEDELDCREPKTKCTNEEKLCKGLCISNNSICNESFEPAVDVSNSTCNSGDFKCTNNEVCLSRWQLCDDTKDCPDGSDEDQMLCKDLQCDDDQFQCTSKACIWKSWQCDGFPDCPDGADEVGCENSTCSQGFFHCTSGECIDMSKLCDKKQDCLDYSDEEQCDDDGILSEVEGPECEENEYMCQLNRSICLPLSVRCDKKIDCPGGTDESDCSFACNGNPNLFQCVQEHFCVLRRKLCDGVKDCLDGSDEFPANCPNVKKTLPPKPSSPCLHGYSCASGQCVEWRSVCDQAPDCFDGSDEGGDCFTSCENNTCSHSCQPTPYGGVCQCPGGYKIDEHNTCVDIDECLQDVCSQKCQNLNGSFVCTCFHGYSLRTDLRTCKAIKGHMSILYVSGNTVRATESDGSATIYYKHNEPIRDIDLNVRDNKLYLISAAAGQLIEVNASHENVVVTNIGQPSLLAVDWITGNVYFVDSSPAAQAVRVCHLRRRRCARLQRLSSDAKVTAFIVDPPNNRMFYCLTQDQESVIWSSTLSGGATTDLGTARSCQGLAADSFRRRLYVAEGMPAKVYMLSYDGEGGKTLITSDVNLQSPHRMALFEDHLYYLVANSFQIGRCGLRGGRCQPYVYRVLDADTFALRHESAQRGDVPDTCSAYRCTGICVIEDSPQCICEDGTLTKNGSDCALLDRKLLPLFNGYTASELERSHVSKALLAALLVMGAWLLLLLVVYYFVYKPRRDAVNPIPVRFQNTTPKDAAAAGGSESGIMGLPHEPSVEIGASSGRNEFTNPLQYVRNLIRHSFHRAPRPVGTASLTINVPQYDSSDTESELDSRDTKGFLPRRK